MREVLLAPGDAAHVGRTCGRLCRRGGTFMSRFRFEYLLSMFLLWIDGGGGLCWGGGNKWLERGGRHTEEGGMLI